MYKRQLTACGRTSEQKVTEIRVAFNQNENHPQYRAMKAFGEKFEKETKGRYHVTIYPNGVLGEQGAMAEFIRTGALQMAIVPCSCLLSTSQGRVRFPTGGIAHEPQGMIR